MARSDFGGGDRRDGEEEEIVSFPFFDSQIASAAAEGREKSFSPSFFFAVDNFPPGKKGDKKKEKPSLLFSFSARQPLFAKGWSKNAFSPRCFQKKK